MDETLQFLLLHGYTILFLWVFAEQMGLPLPSLPVLLAAGALAAKGQLNFAYALALVMVASLLSDIIWYEIGRRKGSMVLNSLCRISLEPDSCVRRTEDLFARYGSRSLVVAKFVPGLNTAAPPLAGIFGMKLLWFLLFDFLGALLWALSFMFIGYLFSSQLEALVEALSRLGGSLATVLVVALVLYIGWKYLQRRRFLSELRIARITPEELKRKLDAGEDLVVVDLRHSLHFEADPRTVPGAVQMTPEEIEGGQVDLPRDRELIFYCT